MLAFTKTRSATPHFEIVVESEIAKRLLIFDLNQDSREDFKKKFGTLRSPESLLLKIHISLGEASSLSALMAAIVFCLAAPNIEPMTPVQEHITLPSGWLAAKLRL